VREAGRHVVWHEGANLPASFAVTVRTPGGAALPLDLPGSQTWTDSSVTRTAAAKFTAPVAGRYTIEVTGSFDPRTMAVTRDFTGSMLGVVAGAILAALLGVAAGITMAVAVVVKRNAGSGAGGPATPAVKDSEKALRELTAVVYALQAASFVTGITLIGGVVINYLKRDAVAGTWLESHFRWQVRTFWWTLAWAVIGFVTTIVLVGFAVWLAAAIWLVYRIVKGWLRLNDGQPVG